MSGGPITYEYRIFETQERIVELLTQLFKTTKISDFNKYLKDNNYIIIEKDAVIDRDFLKEVEKYTDLRYQFTELEKYPKRECKLVIVATTAYMYMYNTLDLTKLQIFNVYGEKLVIDIDLTKTDFKAKNYATLQNEINKLSDEIMDLAYDISELKKLERIIKH